MADYNAGSATITVGPNLSGFVDRLRADLERVEVDYGVNVVPELGDFAGQLEAELARVDARYTVQVGPDLDGFAAELRSQLAAVDADFTIDVDADTNAATARIEEASRDRRSNILVELAEYALTGAAAELDNMSRDRTATIRANADTGAAEVALDTASRDRESHFDVDLNVDLGKLSLISLAIGGIGGAAGLAGGAVGGLGVGILGLGTTALPVIGAIALGVDGIKEAAQNAAPAFTNLKNAVSGAFSTALAPTFTAVGTALDAWTPALASIGTNLAEVMSGFLGVFTSAQGIPVVTSFLSGTAAMAGQLHAGFTTLGTGISDTMGAITPHLSSIGAGVSELIGSIGGALTELQSTGALTVIFANLGDALAGTGALLGDLVVALGNMGTTVLPVVEPLFRNLGETLLQIADPLAALGAAFGTALTSILPVVGSLVSALAGAFTPLMPVLATVIQTLGPVLTQAIQAITPAVAPLATALGSVISAIAPILPVVGQLIGQLADSLGPVISQIATTLGPPLVQILTSVGGAFGDVVAALAPVIGALVSALGPVLQALAPVFQQLAVVIGQVAQTVGGLLVQAVQMIAPFLPQIVGAFGQLLTTLLPLIPVLLQLAISVLQPLLQVFVAILPALMPLLPVIVQLAQVFVQLVLAISPILGLLGQVIGFIGQLLATILGFVAQALAAVLGWVASVIGGFANLIATVSGAVSGWVSAIVGFFTSLAAQALGAAQTMWTTVTGAFSDGVARAVTFVGELPGRITGIFSAAGSWLYNAGKDVVAGLINGLTDMMSEAYNRVRDMASNIANVAKDALGIHSPSRVFMEIGAFVNEGLALGIEQTRDKPAASVSGTLGGVVGTAVSHVGQMVSLAGDVSVGARALARGDYDPSLRRVGLEEDHPLLGPALDAGVAARGMWNLAANRDYDGGLARFGIQEDNPLVDLGLAAFDARRGINSAIATAAPGLFAGAGGPRDDANLIKISDKEFVVNAAATSQWLPLLEAINGGQPIPGFADGGSPGGRRAKKTEKQLEDFIWARDGKMSKPLEGASYDWGDGSPSSWGDCSGAMSIIAGFLAGMWDNSPIRRLFATGSEGETLASLGFEDGPWQRGYMGIGWLNGGPAGGHTAGTLPSGTNVEMGGGRGNGQIAGGAAGWNDPYFTTGHMRIRVGEPFTPKIPGKVGISGTATPSVDTTMSFSGATGGAAAAAPAAPKTWSELAGTFAKDVVGGQVSDALGIFGIPDQLPPILQAYQAMTTDGDPSSWDIATAAAEVSKLDFQVDTHARLVDEAQRALDGVVSSPLGNPLVGAVEQARAHIAQLRRELDELKRQRDEAQRRLEELRAARLAADSPSAADAAGMDLSGVAPGDVATAQTVALKDAPKPPIDEVPTIIYAPSGGAEQWRPLVRAAMKKQGYGGNQAEEDAWVRQIQTESGGNPSIRQGIVDVNSGGNEADGLLQVARMTFEQYRDPALPDDRYDPWANVNAAIRYGHGRYGDRLLTAIGDGDGYATGGTITGGSGVRDDVVIKAMRGEEMIRRTSADAARPVLQAMNASPSFAAQVNQAFNARGNSEVETSIPTTTTTFNISAGDPQDAFREARLEDSRRQMSYLGAR